MTDLYESTSEIDEDTQKGRFLTFLIDKETYGIEIKYVTEIIGLQAMTEMPDMPNHIKGIINLRGKIILLMDVRLRFGMEPRAYDDRTCVVVIDYNGGAIGLIVDKVSEVLTIPDEGITEVPKLQFGLDNRYVKNIGKVGDGVDLLIDCEKLLSTD